MPTPDALTVLQADHDRVNDLLEDLQDARRPDKRKELLQRITEEVRIHAKIEEDIFYPRVARETASKEGRLMIVESKEEHDIVDTVLSELESIDPATEEFEGKVRVLRDLIHHHLDEEQDEMFPVARDVMEDYELQELGRELLAHKDKVRKRYVKEQTA